ncbi:MAG TPA: PAS domain S-box protein [Azospirillaceae bacterium]|nr:PAS domain S-box protein [Azospirillaceae bacterium]
MADVTEDIPNRARPQTSTVPLASVPIAALISDATGRVVACNARALRLWGHSAGAERIAHRLEWPYRLLQREDGPATGAGQERAAVIPLPDGTIREVLVSTVSMVAEDGAVAGTISYFQERPSSAAMRDLDEAERRVRALFSQTHAFIGLLSPDGTLLDCNDLSLNAGGVSRQEVIGKPFADTPWWRISEQARMTTRAALARAALGEVVLDESPFLGHDGAERLVDRAFTPVKNEEGRVLYIVAAGRDITEQRRMELALRERERHLEAIINTTPECLKIVDADGRLLTMNPAGLAMIGMPEGGAVGLPVLDIIAPEHRAEWWRQHRRVCAGETLNWVFDIVGRDGRRRTMETHAVPLTMPDGRLAQLSATRDISARRRAEQALQESERRLRLALQAGSQVPWEWDITNDTIHADAAFRTLFGLPQEAPGIGMEDWLARIVPDERDRVEAEIKVAVNSRQAFSTEFQIFDADGPGKWIAADAIIDRTDDGRPLRMIGTSRDISARKRDEQRQWLLMREVDHRAKNLLAVVQSLIRLTLRNDPKSFPATIERRTAALARAHVLLARSRWEPVSLRQVVDMELTAAKMESWFQLEGPNVYVDPDAVQPLCMAINELAAGAAKPSHDGARDVSIRLEWRYEENGSVRIDWTEVGASEPQKPRSGFGLSLVNLMATQLGSGASFDQKPDGLRCRFSISAEQISMNVAGVRQS